MLNGLEGQDPHELGERLKAARSRAGLTQEEAAQAIEVARTTIVALEKGQRRLRAEELRALAESYGLSVNRLLRPNAVHVDLVPRLRAHPDVAEGPVGDAAKLLNDLAAAEVELERLLGQPLKPNYPTEQPIRPGDVREQAEDRAIELRQRLGLGLAPVPDMVGLLELEMGVRVFVRPLASRSLSGLFVYDDELGACILLNRNHPRGRRALTAAHELAHLISARRAPDVVDLERGPQSREERFAVAFSLAFLMPAPLVRRRFQDVQQETGRFSPRHLILMAHTLNVSMEAMCRRLEQLKMLPGGTWDSLTDRGFSGEAVREVLGDGAKAQSDVVVPPRLWLLAASAYEKGLLSEGQLARMLRMDRLEVRAMLDSLDAEGADDLIAIAAD